MKSLCIRISDIPTDKTDKDTVGIQPDILWGRDTIGKSSAILLSLTTYYKTYTRLHTIDLNKAEKKR